jgi:hypothetical protein
MIFEIFNTLEVQIFFSWLIIPCSLVDRYKCLVDAAAKIFRAKMRKIDTSGSPAKLVTTYGKIQCRSTEKSQF